MNESVRARIAVGSKDWKNKKKTRKKKQKQTKKQKTEKRRKEKEGWKYIHTYMQWNLPIGEEW